MTLDKVKTAIAAIFLFVTGAFFYERSRRKNLEAINDNKEVLDEIAKGDAKKVVNDEKLKAEEEKREEIRKDGDTAKSDDSSDVADFLKKR